MTTRRTFIKDSLGAITALSILPSVNGAANAAAETAQKTAGSRPIRRAAASAGLSKSELDRLYENAIVMDTLSNSGPDPEEASAVNAGMTACVVDMAMYPRNMPNALKALAGWNEVFSKPDSPFIKVLKASDIRAAKEQKKLGVILACQDASILDASTASVNDYNIQNLKKYYEMGLRVLQLTHNERNSVGDSFREKTNAGLSWLGENVVHAMNEYRMLIDLSHCGYTTTMEAIKLSKRPCAITHAGCRALCPTRRDKTDAEIRAVAQKGGTFGVFNMSLWLTRKNTTSLDDVLDHIDHAVNLAGVDHVSFGSDGPITENTTPLDQQLQGMQSYAKRNLGMPGAEWMPHHTIVPALNTPKRLYVLAEGLSKRGYKGAAIEKIIGGNFARVFGEVCG